MAKRKPRKQIKSPMKRFTFNDFLENFPDDKACLAYIKNKRWPDGIHCKKCERVTKHHYATSRRSYCCQFCGNHVHPTAGTIFHKSTTSLVLWFYAIYLMSQTRGGISAKQIERELGVTYKTAWRMCKLIRSRLDEDSDPFGGDDNDVEIDESYFGGKHKGGKRGRGSENKTAVLGIVQRKGGIKAIAVPNVKRKTVMPIIEDTVKKGATIHTDEFNVYDTLGSKGYSHHRIMHSHKIYVMGNVHTQTIDGFWALVKNGITGVYHHVSPKYLQHYLNEYGFRYTHRNDVTPMFLTILGRTTAKVL